MMDPEMPPDPRLTPPPPRKEADVLRHLERMKEKLSWIIRDIQENVKASEKRHPDEGE